MLRRATSLVLLLSALPGQTPARPTYAPPVQRVEAAGQRLAGALNAGNDEQVEVQRAAFDAAVDALLANEELLSTSDCSAPR